MHDFEPIWKAWILLFIVTEAIAIYMGGDRTLSHNVWRWFNVADGWSIERYVLLIFCLWLLIHFAWMKLG